MISSLRQTFLHILFLTSLATSVHGKIIYTLYLATVKLGCNELCYNEFGYNEFGYNKLSYDGLGCIEQILCRIGQFRTQIYQVGTNPG
jgi:hypothetical protein